MEQYIDECDNPEKKKPVERAAVRMIPRSARLGAQR